MIHKNRSWLAVTPLTLGLLIVGCGRTPQTAVPVLSQGAGSTNSPRHDFTDAVNAGDTSSEYVVVTLSSPPTAQYDGSTADLKRTRPEKGKKLDANSPAAQAYQKFLQTEHASYRAFLARSAPVASVEREFFLTSNSLAIRANGASLNSLKSGPNVKSVEYATLYRPTMNRSLDLIGVTAAWRQTSGLNGQGIKVGVIDSGIDDKHPFFACKTGIQHKVYASGVAGSGVTLSGDHGTHVAGTIAGCVTTLTSGPLAGRTLSGVAPAARLYDYNVFPAFGGAYKQAHNDSNNSFSHDIAQAVEDAVRDGMDVVNMSLGGSVNGPNDMLAQAVNAAVDAGVVFSISAGNSGPDGYSIGSPGSAENAITVGAVTNNHYIGVKIDLSNGQSYGGAAGDFDPYSKVKAAGWGMAVASPANGCTTIGAGVAGKIAIIDRGACAFSVKVRNAQQAGAIGVLVVNNQPGDPAAMGSDGTPDQPTIPALMVSLTDGPALKAAANAGVTATIDGTQQSEIVTDNARLVAGFSSRGPTPFTGIIKPDVVAPGVNIYSSVFNGQYAMFSGTSMAAPHVAGSAALVRQAHPDWSALEVKAALATTAQRPAVLDSSIASPLKIAARGSGLINVPSAVTVPALVTPSNLSFGYHNQGGYSKTSALTLSIRSVGAGGVTCSASATGGVTLSASSVNATPTGTLTVSLNTAAGRAGDEEGAVTLTCNGIELYIPWASYQNRPGKG